MKGKTKPRYSSGSHTKSVFIVKGILTWGRVVGERTCTLTAPGGGGGGGVKCFKGLCHQGIAAVSKFSA